ncbi:restriction endonuclease subunit S [Prevotella corporis]|uniref:restriction endonuclease subunit S n=1 Tax=Prevotella corporis TaxID=28128 RepID=UPI0027E4716C|nr:restriction endonuclease subunit S [Prevotella corporis]MDQ7736457.1 restriction endonuclease subunit S [Prevotella corporis]
MSSYYEKIHATGEVKCIDDEVPFEIPKGWEWCRLNDLAMYRKGPFGSSLTKSMFVTKSTQSIKVYEQKNAIQKKHTLGDYYISPKKFETMQSFVVKPNDIIVSCAGTIGETYLLPSDASIGIINQALMRVSLFDLNMAEYWQIYFAYMLLNEAQMKGAGSAIKNIPPFEYLKAVLVPIPPLSEQNRLVERYNIILSLIDKYELEANKLNRLNQNIYDKLKKSVLQEAIQGKLVPQIDSEGTAQELLEQIKKEKRKLVKEGKLKKSALNDSVIFRSDDNKYYEQVGKEFVDITEEIPFPIPANWQWVRIRDVFQLNPKNEADDETLAAFIPMEKISAGYKSDFTFDLVKWGNIKKGFTHFANGDVAFAKITPCFQNRKSAIFHDLPNGIGAGTTELKVLRPYGNTIGRWYLLYFLESPYFIDEATFKGTANQQRIVVGYLENKLFPLPPRKQQQRIVEKIEQLMQLLK